MNDLATVPYVVRVAFRGTGAGSSPFFYVDVPLADLALPGYPNIVGSPWIKLLHRYELATYIDITGPTNEAALTALAERAAADWYNWQLALLDQYFIGIVDWIQEGFHDIEWRQQGKITTRVFRGLANDQDDFLYPAAAPDEQKFYAIGITMTAITARAGTVWGTGTALLYYEAGGQMVTEGEAVTVFNACEEIPISWFVDVHIDKNGSRFVTPRCLYEGVPGTTSWYCMEEPVTSWYCMSAPEPTVLTGCCPEDGIPITYNVNIAGLDQYIGGTDPVMTVPVTYTGDVPDTWIGQLLFGPRDAILNVIVTCNLGIFSIYWEVGPFDVFGFTYAGGSELTLACDPFGFTGTTSIMSSNGFDTWDTGYDATVTRG